MTDPKSVEYLSQARARIARARRRQTAWFTLILGPFAIAIILLRAFAAHDYASGDFRNDPAFWIAAVLANGLFWAALIVAAARRLRTEPRPWASPDDASVRDTPER